MPQTGLQRQAVAATTVYETISCSGCYKRCGVCKLVARKTPHVKLILKGFKRAQLLLFAFAFALAAFRARVDPTKFLMEVQHARHQFHKICHNFTIFNVQCPDEFANYRILVDVKRGCGKVMKHVKLYECWNRSRHVPAHRLHRSPYSCRCRLYYIYWRLLA